MYVYGSRSKVVKDFDFGHTFWIFGMQLAQRMVSIPNPFAILQDLRHAHKTRRKDAGLSPCHVFKHICWIQSYLLKEKQVHQHACPHQNTEIEARFLEYF